MRNNIYTGTVLAIVAVIIWSGNFIAARGIISQISPINLAFYRWLTASIILFPFAIKQLLAEKETLLQHKGYFFWTALSGIALFNTFVYIAAHHVPAINLALIGTTLSPVFAIILAAVFLKEPVRPLRIAGLLLCVSGIVLLLSRGSWQRLQNLRFTSGDGWIVAAAFTFAVYTILVRRKPAGISPRAYLLAVFTGGTLLLLPWFVYEQVSASRIEWSTNLLLVILYLGAGASVIAFLCWNLAIARLGAARTAIFGNLIPVFASLEAVWILNEQITWLHGISSLLVLAGLVLANMRKANP
ncbi:MAG: DMT family transporter [Chitinophagaceae bacterium]